MFIVRLLSGIMLLILSFLFVNAGGLWLTAILFVISETAYFEMCRALKIYKDKKVNALLVTGFVLIAIYYALMAVSANPTFLVMTVVLGIILYLMVYVFSFPKYSFEEIAGAIFGFMYAPIMLSFMALTRGLEYGKYTVWLIYISAWGADTLAYCAGMLTGKTIGNHKMTPKLSPKKSIEGAVGGVLGAALLGWLYTHFIMMNYVTGFEKMDIIVSVICAVGGFISMIGDLAASAVKRNKDIKDYGHCIPGHGGILDRFDSMIFTAPITYFLLVIALTYM